MFAAPLPKGLAQRRHMDGEVALLDGLVGPDTRQQIVLRGQLPAVLDERHEEIEGLRMEGHGRAVAQQQPPGGVDHEAVEASEP